MNRPTRPTKDELITSDLYHKQDKDSNANFMQIIMLYKCELLSKFNY